MAKQETSPNAPMHTPGASRDEAKSEREGKEPRRDEDSGRMAEDSTGINPDDREPVDPGMPEMPPA